MKKLIFISILLLLCFSLFSYNKNEFFDLFFPHLDSFPPKNKPIVLDVEAAEMTMDLKNRIKEYLLNNSYKLLDTPTEDCNILKVNINKVVDENIKRSLFKKRLETKTSFSLSFEIVASDSREIIKFKVKDFELIETKKIKNGDKWYDPLMISAIVGGLVYLFYYGNN